MSDAPLMLSVSGLRGLVGRSLTPAVASGYAAAAGQWFKGQGGTGGAGGAMAPHVVVGRDSRPSGQMVELAAVAGLVAVGCRVTRLGIVTTPGTAVMVDHLKADGGMVITASHNPIIWNGIKTLSGDGVAPPPAEAMRIIERFNDDDVAWADVESLAPVVDDATCHDVHVQRVLAQVDAAAIAGRRIKVVLDSVHGAGGPATAMLLDKLGVQVVHLFAEPTGRFPHEPEPVRQNLTGLCDAVRQHGADAGFAQDPDADRLAVVDEQGRYIGEEYSLALAALHVLTRPGAPASGSGATVVANLSTSRMIDDIAAQCGARIVRTPVGEANVAAVMRQCGAIVGGEGNGGVIFPPVIHVRDSLIGIALVLELLAQRGQALSEVVAQIPHYAIVKDKVAIQPGMSDRLAPVLRERFAAQRIDLQDGVRVDWPDRWVHVRPSNTEPILRIIAEAPDDPAATALIADVRDALSLGAATV